MFLLGHHLLRIASQFLVGFCVANAVIFTTASLLLISPLAECRLVETAEAARCSSVLDDIPTIRSEGSPHETTSSSTGSAVAQQQFHVGKPMCFAENGIWGWRSRFSWQFVHVFSAFLQVLPKVLSKSITGCGGSENTFQKSSNPSKDSRNGLIETPEVVGRSLVGPAPIEICASPLA
jgi:hypothetical protein